jgi:hypothetical protein
MSAYIIESHDQHYYAPDDPTGVKWTPYPSQAQKFGFAESAQAVIDHCRYNAKVRAV